MSKPFNDSDRPGDGSPSARPVMPHARATANSGPANGDETDLFNLLDLARVALRGRLTIALLIALLFAVPLGIAGYTGPKKTYESRATIDVQAALNTIIYDEIGDTGERLETYIDRQTETIGSQRVMDFALQDEQLRELGWPTGNEGIIALRNGLETSFNRRDTVFRVTMKHPDPGKAQAALDAVVKSYMEFVNEENSVENDVRRLDNQLRRLDGNIANIQANISAATAEFGNAPLEPQIKIAEERNIEILDRISKLESEIILREQRGDGDEPESDPTEFTLEQLADFDRDLETLLARRSGLESEMEQKSRTLGSRHPSMVTLREEIDRVGSLINERAEVVRARLVRQDPGRNPEALTLEELRNQLEIARRQQLEADRRRNDLNRTFQIVRRDQLELERLMNQRQQIATERGKIEVERDALAQGRVRVITPATPAVLSNDRRKMFAVAGFGLGGMLGIGLVAGYGIVRRSFRYVDDIDDPNRLPPLLGTLPELDRKDPDAERIAAISVHNLRNMLHATAGYGNEPCQVIVCTSAEPGDGKTTLIQSLGASYALTGQRTIVVDLDLVGAGLSARLGMTGRRGVADLLGGLEPTKCIKRTATEKLYALPAGDRHACRPEQLAHRPIQQVIDWLRERFDVILVDTGPVLGSLEAGLSIAIADQILLVVPRGQPDRVARAAVARLEKLGAKRTGLIFNRARTTDIKQSLSAASVGAPSVTRGSRRPPERSLDDDSSIVGSIPPVDLDSPRAKPAAEDGTGT